MEPDLVWGYEAVLYCISRYWRLPSTCARRRLLWLHVPKVTRSERLFESMSITKRSTHCIVLWRNPAAALAACLCSAFV